MMTGIGKALLLDADESEWRQLFLAHGELCHLPDFLGRMRGYADAGFAFDLEENEPTIRCVAAPVYDAGNHVVAALQDCEIASVATFAHDKQERRREKMAFYMGDARIKATTVHSFKGWETPLLVIHIDATAGAQSLALIYVGLTRLKRRASGSCLTVVCSNIELVDFGRTWPDFVSG